MSNSPLVSYTRISPNKTSPRNHAIDTITIHCVVGQLSVETLGNVFAPVARKASCNYGIGYDGRIGMYVEEKDRSWCTSSKSNDNRAITIEVASDTSHPYAVTEKAYASLINLCVDVCRRNGIKELKWKGDKSLIGKVDKQNMTVHRWFANKSCPGDYLYNLHGQIAAEVNQRLNGVNEEVTAPVQPYYRVRKSWNDASSQLGAYKTLVSAKKKADENPGYYVFNETGDIVYPDKPVKKKVAPAKSRDISLAGGYRVYASGGLNMRYEPGNLDDDNIVKVLPWASIVMNYGYFTEVDGDKWLYVSNGRDVGYVHSKYVRKLK